MTGFPAPDAVLVGGSVLPPGLDLAGDGTISGTPTTAGTWTITIGATNAYAFAQQTYTVTVAAGDATSLQASTPMTTVAGSPYPAPVTAKVTDAYGNPESGIPITFTLPTSAPSGIFQASGVSAISVPTGADGIADAGVVLAGAFPGSYDVVVSNPGLGTTTVALTATAGPPIFLERALPPGGITEPYGHVIAITGSATVRLVGGALPAGLTLSRTGTLSGTPTAVGKYAFTVRATNANGVRKGRLTLAVLPPPKLSVLDASFLEGPFNQEHGYSVNLHLSRPSTLSVTVAYRTQDGTATAGSDYRAASGIATFAPGETDAFATIAVIGDDVPEPDETLTIRLSSPQHATIARTTATLTLLNDD
jgi:hypothetical protein